MAHIIQSDKVTFMSGAALITNKFDISALIFFLSIRDSTLLGNLYLSLLILRYDYLPCKNDLIDTGNIKQLVFLVFDSYSLWP